MNYDVNVRLSSQTATITKPWNDEPLGTVNYVAVRFLDDDAKCFDFIAHDIVAAVSKVSMIIAKHFAPECTAVFKFE